MKSKSKGRFKSLFLLPVIAIICPCIAKAQYGAPNHFIDIPIDGGLSVLITAGLCYGVKKIADNKKEK